MDIRIGRIVDPLKAQRIRQLELAVWGEQVTSFWDAAIFARNGFVLGAVHANHLVGGLVASRAWNNTVFVHDIVLAPECRRMGIGKKLYATLFGECCHELLTIVEAYVEPSNDSSLCFHRSLGFDSVCLEKNPYGSEPSEPRWLLRKLLQ